jgi:hypothetical protein
VKSLGGSSGSHCQGEWFGLQPGHQDLSELQGDSSARRSYISLRPASHSLQKQEIHVDMLRLMSELSTSPLL